MKTRAGFVQGMQIGGLIGAVASLALAAFTLVALRNVQAGASPR